MRWVKIFGRRARRIRIEKGLKRKDAEAVGIDPSNLDKIEKGKRVHLVTVIPKLSKLLGVHQSELIDFPFDYDPDPVVSRKPDRKRTKSK
ncbi:MAG: helix-turn-helix transcriptional regulator [Bacteroidota bacterium]